MNGNKMLIADDDPDLLDFLVLRCRAWGFEVTTAYDGITALRAACDDPPDVICMDVNMPGGNGLTACELLAEDERFRDLPMIILTGSADRETVRRCHGLGCYYVPKCADVWPRIVPILEQFFGSPLSQCLSLGPL